MFSRTTGSPQAKSPGGSSSGVVPPSPPTAPQNKALHNVKGAAGDHPSVSTWIFYSNYCNQYIVSSYRNMNVSS